MARSIPQRSLPTPMRWVVHFPPLNSESNCARSPAAVYEEFATAGRSSRVLLFTKIVPIVIPNSCHTTLLNWGLWGWFVSAAPL